MSPAWAQGPAGGCCLVRFALGIDRELRRSATAEGLHVDGFSRVVLPVYVAAGVD
jgi:hypothetical protein